MQRLGLGFSKLCISVVSTNTNKVLTVSRPIGVMSTTRNKALSFVHPFISARHFSSNANDDKPNSVSDNDLEKNISIEDMVKNLGDLTLTPE